MVFSSEELVYIAAGVSLGRVTMYNYHIVYNLHLQLECNESDYFKL